MGKLKKITAKLFTPAKSATIGNGLSVSLEELMEMRNFAKYLQNNRRIKSYSEQAGDIKSAFKGRGIELEEIREYAFGDDVRDIDWRVSARKEKPYTKIYLEERDHEIWVWLDLSNIMLFGSKWELKAVSAAKVAALLGWVALNNKDRFGCIIFDGAKTWLFKPKNDRAYLTAILKKIAEISTAVLAKNDCIKEEKVRSLKLLQANVKGKASVFMVSSFNAWKNDFDADIATIAKKSRTFLLDIEDELEIKAPRSGQYMAEYNGKKMLLDSSGKSYQKEYAAYFANLKKQREDFCRRFGCKLIEISAPIGIAKNLKML